MERATTSRALAFRLLLERERSGGDITNLLKGALQSDGASLSVQDRAFAKRLAVCTVERQLPLDAVLGQCLRQGREKKRPRLKPGVRCILRMGACQLLFLEGVPDAAAVNESVKLAKENGLAGLSGLVNGVLRRIGREKEQICSALAGEAPWDGWLPDIALRLSATPYLWDLFVRERGEQAAEDFFAQVLKPRPLTVRPDPRLLADPAREKEWRRELSDAVGGVREHPLVPELLIVDHPGDVRELPGFREGLFVVQDAAGALAVQAAGIRKRDRVLDVCAAPGGKAMYAAALLGDPAQMTARDKTEEKCALLKENAARLGLSGMRIEVRDAAEYREKDAERYDVVLCDLPCTGFGVMGRKPEIRYHASAEQTAALVELQQRILQVSARYVKPGGTLLYSTCTVSRAENEDQVRRFLSADSVRDLFELQAFPMAPEGMLQLLPGAQDTDGFFIARLKRKEQP